MDRDTLYDLYWKENMTLEQIAPIYGVTAFTIGKWMNDYQIPKRKPGRRKISE